MGPPPPPFCVSNMRLLGAQDEGWFYPRRCGENNSLAWNGPCSLFYAKEQFPNVPAAVGEAHGSEAANTVPPRNLKIQSLIFHLLVLFFFFPENVYRQSVLNQHCLNGLAFYHRTSSFSYRSRADSVFCQQLGCFYCLFKVRSECKSRYGRYTAWTNDI